VDNPFWPRDYTFLWEKNEKKRTGNISLESGEALVLFIVMLVAPGDPLYLKRYF
jgi:hypothetical protein